jgi:hypothetical protein
MCSAGWKRFAKMFGAHEKDASTYHIRKDSIHPLELGLLIFFFCSFV